MFLADLSGIDMEAKAALTGEAIQQLNSPHWYFIWIIRIQGGMLFTIFNSKTTGSKYYEKN